MINSAFFRSFIRLLTHIRLALKQRFPDFYRKLPGYWRLMRMDRPIGFYLLLWPTLWCLWIAAGGLPDLHLIIIFTLGSLLMRAAGCCMNDFADQNIDGKVARTASRPLVSGQLEAADALKCCGTLCLIAFFLVLLTNALTIMLSFVAVVIAMIYPFMKRYTHLPQVVLGAAFSMGGLMAFTAQTGSLPAQAWLFFLANLFWTIAYDTLYAMSDREEDLRIGVKSTAILFGEADKLIVALLQLLFLGTLYLSAGHFGLGGWFMTGLVVAAGFFVYQHKLAWRRESQPCFQAFLNNNKVGAVIFFFTLLDLHLG